MPKFTREIKKTLHVKLDEAKREEAVSLMCETVKYKDSIEVKKSEQNKVWNESIKEAESTISKLAYNIEYGVRCDVKCEMVINPDSGRVIVFRKDTGEMIEDRKMSHEDNIQITDVPESELIS